MVVVLQNIYKRYGQTEALQNINFTFEKGRIYGLLGPNGSGKSTTLKLMTGLVFPDQGTVTVNDEPVTRKTCIDVAYLTELDMFYDTFSVRETVEYVASQFSNFNMEKAIMLLNELKLDSTSKVRSLSKGNRGRLKLVTTLSRDAEVILLDEPFSGLDPMVRDAIVRSLLKYVDYEHQIIVIATHEINEIEPLLDEAIAIFNGVIVGHENVEALREEQGKSVLQWYKELAMMTEEGRR